MKTKIYMTATENLKRLPDCLGSGQGQQGIFYTFSSLYDPKADGHFKVPDDIAQVLFSTGEVPRTEGQKINVDTNTVTPLKIPEPAVLREKSVPLMCDSGAFSFLKGKLKQEIGSVANPYDSEGFWRYLDAYVAFLLQHGNRFNVYVGMDIIGDAPVSLRNQLYMEGKGLTPMPTYHVGEPLEYLERYIAEYDYIGISGLATIPTRDQYRKLFAERVFRLVCPKGIPVVRVHGFGISDPQAIWQWPFYSVDSFHWVMACSHGGITVPRVGPDGYQYRTSRTTVGVTTRNKETRGVSSKAGIHYVDLRPQQRVYVDRYMAEELGTCYEKVRDSVQERFRANFMYYYRLAQVAPEWPRHWTPAARAFL